MELKVWVDGIQRVVCGVSEQTTCQEVVIALARAIGQTGRYVLVQKLREKERQLLPLECPLESLAKCGQYANDVQFVLRRTGPSVAERPSSEGAPQAPERTFIRASLPIKPRPAGMDAPRSRESKKSMTFNLGPTGSGDPFAVSRWRHQAREGMDLEGGGVLQPSKEELFRRVLWQQEQLHSLEAHGDTLETDLRLWERGRLVGQEDEILYLEHLVRRNETELGEEEFWQSELRLEKECERERQERVRSLRASLEEYTQRIYELSARTEALQEEIQWEMAERTKRGKETPVPSPTELEDMAAKMKRDLEAKVKQGTQLESNLACVEKALEEAERNLQLYQPDRASGGRRAWPVEDRLPCKCNCINKPYFIYIHICIYTYIFFTALHCEWMWMARVFLQTAKIKPETDDTKQPSSPADGSEPLPFFYFFKVLSIFNRKQRHSHST
ncbi:ras association domain-containing protein 7 isoform X1 [Balearica regulorum gibbericeps]|uniref:ras association domain-containing protein 7 isoform X1 n=1 Tax=Balearica regulorum gibbericeps TaxID=100784 RepID=UPI003F5FD8AD